jgi:hypothetical protein
MYRFLMCCPEELINQNLARASGKSTHQDNKLFKAFNKIVVY